MKIFIIYTIVIVITIFICILTSGYKKNIFITLDWNTHKLKLFYGLSAFIIDIVSTQIHMINYEKIKSKLSRINVKKADDTEAYLYIISKLSLSIMVFMIFGAAGYIQCCKVTFSEYKNVVYIERPEYGEGKKNYNLMLDYDGGIRKEIDFTIKERKYTKNEVMQMFTDCYDELVTEFLGKNDNLENITDNVNLITEVGNGISVDWNTGESEYIDYSGNIRWENIKHKEKVVIEATLSINDYSQSYVLPLIINKEERDKIFLIQDELNNMLERSSENEKKIRLPDNIAGHNVQFFRKKEKNTLLYLFIGIVTAVIIFVAKEKETDKKLEERKRQLENDYAPIVSKLTILQGSGMTLLSAWDKVIADYEKGKIIGKKKTGAEETDSNDKIRFAYEEMKYVRNRMKAGNSEAASYLEFGRRCGIHSYIKFGNLLEQNIKKGTKGLKDILYAEAGEALEKRKSLARKKGEEAGTKLLIPMGIMLIISIIMIIVPALMTINI